MIISGNDSESVMLKHMAPLNTKNVISIDVEEWFHILDSPVVPHIGAWGRQELRAKDNLPVLLDVLAGKKVKVTFFWLGWMAEQIPKLVKQCKDCGHEIASHGYGHLLAYKVGCEKFREDLIKAKDILENITGDKVEGFRAPGFGITDETPWVFDVIKEVGHEYDSSVFSAPRGHGGVTTKTFGPYTINTNSGQMTEIPMSLISLLGRRVSLFGGGYLRITPQFLIKWGVNKLHDANQPLIVYLHPREIDPYHPRLPLPLVRKFKCYINLKTTMPKLKMLCDHYDFCRMNQLVESFKISSSDATSK